MAVCLVRRRSPKHPLVADLLQIHCCCSGSESFEMFFFVRQPTIDHKLNDMEGFGSMKTHKIGCKISHGGGESRVQAGESLKFRKELTWLL